MKKSKFNEYRFLLGFICLVCYPWFSHAINLCFLAMRGLVVCLLLLALADWELLHQQEMYCTKFITALTVILGVWGVLLNKIFVETINEKSQMDRVISKNFETLSHQYFSGDEDDFDNTKKDEFVLDFQIHVVIGN